MTTPPPDGHHPIGGSGGDDAGTVTWGQLVRETEGRLARGGLTSPSVDARRLVEAASGFEGAEYVLGLDQRATVRRVAHLDRMVERRLAGEPLQYVIGAWGFRTLDLMVDRRVLIPRPETEQVAGWALDELDRLVASGSPADRRPVLVDLGTGSGAIALAAASERPGIEVWATDESADALDVASANLAGLGRAGARVRLQAGSWFDALPFELRGSIDVLVSNPPYVAADDELPDEVAAWEPPGALVPGPSGLEALDVIVAGAPSWLAEPGALVVELAPAQAVTVVERARRAGFTDVRVEHDLAGRARAVVARR